MLYGIKIAILCSVRFADLDKFAVTVARQHDPASLLTAKPEPDLAARGCRVIKSRMLAADLAKRALTDIRYYPTKPAIVKMRASAVRLHSEMRNVALLDARADIIGIRAIERGIFRERFTVDVDLPANATAMAAFIGYTSEIAVIFWCKKLHFYFFSVITVS